MWRHVCNHCGTVAPDGKNLGTWLLEHAITCKKPQLPGGYELLPVWFPSYNTTLIRGLVVL